ncbi:MAG: 5,10-methylenetetrahydrofolate reductase [Rhodobacteraceae bacterium]|nr:5,10-methylenetetrahydrofolate reductase [Paracoccaceae bacterium]
MPRTKPTDFGLSFEFFPPKSLEASFKLWSAIETLSVFDPDFVSMTYGAGGTTRDITRSAVGVVAQNYSCDVAGHLTCVGASRSETLAVAEEYAELGATQIVALRGDPEQGSGSFVPHPDGFGGVLELIEALASLNKFKIRVAAYPHTHPEAASADADINALKAKFDAGADSAITQFFFEKDDFLFFRDRCDKAGITQKIIPGILPIENWSKTRLFSARCGTPTPDWMDHAFANAKGKNVERLLSTALCTELCDELLCEGVEDLHFYTLNDPSLTQDVCHALGREQRLPALRAAS